MNILTLDLGEKLGWAVSVDGGVVAGGTENLACNKLSGAGMRYLKFKGWLNGMHEKHDFTECYFEQVAAHRRGGTDGGSGIYAAHAYGGYAATLMTWCEELNIAYEGVPVGTIKKSATGKGNSGKEEVIKAIEAKGYKFVDDNHADALALMLYVLSKK